MYGYHINNIPKIRCTIVLSEFIKYINGAGRRGLWKMEVNEPVRQKDRSKEQLKEEKQRRKWIGK